MVRPRREVDLVRVFRAPRILTFEQLGEKLDLSRSSLVRRLGEHGYHSSYNHSGRFLTIPEVAEFDSRGLWSWKTARFSRLGNLKETIAHFVSSSKAGMTHQELTGLLGVRVHNPLLELVEEGRLSRRRVVEQSFVYFSSRRRHGRQQVQRRTELLKEREKLQLSSQQVIATLLELIKDPEATRADILARCRRSGTSISRQALDVVFELYDLDKKRAL